LGRNIYIDIQRAVINKIKDETVIFEIAKSHNGVPSRLAFAKIKNYDKLIELLNYEIETGKGVVEPFNVLGQTATPYLYYILSNIFDCNLFSVEQKRSALKILNPILSKYDDKEKEYDVYSKILATDLVRYIIPEDLLNILGFKIELGEPVSAGNFDGSFLYTKRIIYYNDNEITFYLEGPYDIGPYDINNKVRWGLY